MFFKKKWYVQQYEWEQPIKNIILNDAGSKDIEGEYIIGNLAWQTRKK